MKRQLVNLVITLTVLAAIAQASCQRAANTNSSSKASDDSIPKPIDESPCQAWNRMISNLSLSEKQSLLQEGAVYTGGNLVLRESLVSDCRLRAEISVYFGKALRGENDNDSDRKFAASHSEEIIKVLRRIWPSLSDSKALIGDGNFGSEKYNLLSDPALDSSTLASLIGDILEKEGVGNEIVFILLSRPMPKIKPALSRQLKKAESKGDIPQQIYAIASLQSIGDPTAISKLKSLSKNKHLSTFEKKLIPALIAKIERGERLVFSDIEDLEYLNDR